MGKIIAVFNQKGGVGKTTTTMNVAAGLRDMGKNVLAIDLDPQGSLTTCFGFEPAEMEKTISQLLEALIRRAPVESISDYIVEKNGMSLIPANITLSVTDVGIVTATAREYLLQKLLLGIKDEYDYILIDCLPSLGMLAINALTAADSIIVPIKAQYLDIKGFELLLSTLNLVKEETNRKLSVAGIVITMYDSRIKLAKQVAEALHDTYGSLGIKIFNTIISQSTKAAEASIEGKDIYAYSKDSKTSSEYAALTQEVLECLS